MSEILTATFFAVFLTETIKIAAKGTAVWLKDNGEFLFYNEITQLGLNQSATTEELAKQLEAKPEVIEAIQTKVAASPDFVKELFETVKEQTQKQFNAKNVVNAKNVGTIINDSHAPITITNNFS
jgi:hypothetical protein